MTDYIEKALEGEYEDYIEFLSKLVENEIDNKKIPLREAAEAVVSDAFYQLRGDISSLDRLMLKANEVLDPPCHDDEELESHTFDEVVECMSSNGFGQTCLELRDGFSTHIYLFCNSSKSPRTFLLPS